MSQDFKHPFINCPAELSAERKLLHGVQAVYVNKSKFLFSFFNCPRSLKRCCVGETLIEVESTVKVICGVESLSSLTLVSA